MCIFIYITYIYPNIYMYTYIYKLYAFMCVRNVFTCIGTSRECRCDQYILEFARPAFARQLAPSFYAVSRFLSSLLLHEPRERERERERNSFPFSSDNFSATLASDSRNDNRDWDIVWALILLAETQKAIKYWRLWKLMLLTIYVKFGPRDY